jgi:TRAP transporter TAXI family solute receptor
MSRTRKEILYAVAILSFVGLVVAGTAAYWYMMRSSQFRVAVLGHNGSEYTLIDAFSTALRDTGSAVSVAPVSFETYQEAAKALQGGRVSLAVLRPDIVLPDNGMTVAILREEALIVAAPTVRKISDIADLAGKRLALVDMQDPDRDLMLRVLALYEINENNLRLSRVAASQVPSLVKARQIDAIAFLATPVSSEAGALIRSFARATGGEIHILPIDEAEAMSLRMPVFTTMKIPAGAFGGRPKQPGEELTTIGVSYRLMAASKVDRGPISELTAQLFRLRSRISNATATINSLKAPDPDSATSAALPVHPGAVDYLNREQLTFMDRWGDWLWLGLFAGGGVTSAMAWVGQFFVRRKREAVDEVLEQLSALLGKARKCSNSEELEKVTLALDELVRQSVRFTRKGLTNTRTMSALMLAIDSTRAAISDRRRSIQ